MPATYTDVPHREGFFELDDYDLYYRAVGEGPETMLCLHGGPGGSSDYLAPMVRLGGDDRTVYLYDQFGCGRSDTPAPGDFDRYTVEHYRAEVEAVRKTIGAEELVLYGHSWGGVLAQEYALASPDRVSKLVLSGTLHDTGKAIEVMRAARREVLSDEDLETMEAKEAAREFEDPEYRALTEQVYDEVLLRGENPLWREKSRLEMDIYGLMWGPTEFALAETARLRDWSVRDRLPELETPTLVVVGEHDEIGPQLSRDMADLLPNARLEELPGTSHHIYWEEPEAYFAVLEDFLAS